MIYSLALLNQSRFHLFNESIAVWLLCDLTAVISI